MSEQSMTMETAGKRRRYHHGDLAKALQRTALQIIGEKGVGGVTLTEAARLAGVSHAAAYRHYASLQALLVATAEECYDQWNQRRANQPFDTPHPTGEILALLHDYFALARDDTAAFALIFDSDIQRMSTLIAGYGQRDYQRFLSMVSRATGVRPERCHVVALAIMATVLGHVRMSLDGMSMLSMDEAADAAAEAVQMLLTGFAENHRVAESSSGGEIDSGTLQQRSSVLQKADQ